MVDGCDESTNGHDELFECGGSRRGETQLKDVAFCIGDPSSPYKSTRMHKQGIFRKDIWREQV
jgi:hypothetical protein